MQEFSPAEVKEITEMVNLISDSIKRDRAEQLRKLYRLLETQCGIETVRWKDVIRFISDNLS